MRIGQVNTENYKEFLKILGVKNPKGLEKVSGENNKNFLHNAIKNKDKPLNKLTMDDFCMDTLEKELAARGIIEEGMLMRKGDTSWRRTVEVSDNIRQKVIDKMREKVLSQSSGRHISAEQADELWAIVKQYRSSIPPSERLAFTYTVENIASAEERRLVDYIRSQVPGWQSGQAFDPRILTGSNWGLNHMDIKA